MNFTRKGKVARLPGAIREELNRRLDNGEVGKKLVAWLNTLPEVQAMVALEWQGIPIREQNLSEWKRGGFREWQARRDALEAAARLGREFAEWSPGEDHPPTLTDSLALWLAGRYAVTGQQLVEAGDADTLPILRELCHGLVQLRRGDHTAERLRLEHTRLELDRNRNPVPSR